MLIELAQVVKAPRDQVFRTFTDYQAWPKFSVLVTRVSVGERAGSTVHLDMEIKVMGRKFWRTEKHVLTPPEQVLVEGETVGSTTTSVWKFDPVPEGTLVTGAIESRGKGLYKLTDPFTKRLLQTSFDKWLRAFVKYVEAQ